jgi:hypothetical protein
MSISEVFVIGSLVLTGVGVVVSTVLIRRAIQSRNAATRFFRLAATGGIVMLLLLILGVGVHMVTPDSSHSGISGLLAAYATVTTWAYGQGGPSILWIVVMGVLLSFGALAGRD